MSKQLDDMRRKLEGRMRSAGSVSAYGTVEKVDEVKRLCDVRIGGVVYENVLLYALENADLKGWVIIPKKGSNVVVSRIGSGSRLYVEMFSEIDKILATIDGTTFQLTAKGFTLMRAAAGLKKTLADLCDALAKLTVSTAVGPSSVPINVADFQKIKKELNDYLEG